MSSFLFAQASPGTVQECIKPFVTQDNFGLSCGTAVSEQMSAAWDEAWNIFIAAPNGIYISIVNIGRIFALLSLGFFIYQFLRSALADESYHSFTDLIWPLIVIVFLANNAELMRQTSTTLRGVINYSNAQVLEIANASLVYEEHLQEVLDYSNAERAIRDVRAQCNGMTSNEQLLACLEEGERRASVIADSFQTRYGASLWTAQLVQHIQQSIADIRANPILAANIKGPFNNPIISLAIEAFLAALQSAFQYLIELSLILTAMLGPLSLGLTLSPLGGKALYAWIIAFLSVGLAKLCFNIITAMLVTMIYEAGPLDIMTNMILLGLLAPVLSFGMAAGGGMAIFNGVLTTIQQVTMGLIPIGVGAALGGKGK